MLIFASDILCLSSQDMFAVQFLPKLLLESFVMPFQHDCFLQTFDNLDSFQ